MFSDIFEDESTVFGRLRILEDREAGNEYGPFGLIRIGSEQINFQFPSRNSLANDLKLIYGVGDATAAKLNQSGYYSLSDLLTHPRWGKAAAELLKIIETGNVERLARYGASDLQLLSFFKPEEVLFIDIETVGLYYIHPVIIVGVLRFFNGTGEISQYFARDFSEEKAILKETLIQLEQAAVITSYNGRSFDLPYLKGRMGFHGLVKQVDQFHFDLLRQARRKYSSVLPNCRLLTIEEHLLANRRNDDIPGMEIADYYQAFLDTGDRKQYLNPILKHNAFDLIAMAKFLGLIVKEGDVTGTERCYP